MIKSATRADSGGGRSGWSRALLTIGPTAAVKVCNARTLGWVDTFSTPALVPRLTTVIYTVILLALAVTTRTSGPG
jgi:hypothetical protein